MSTRLSPTAYRSVCGIGSSCRGRRVARRWRGRRRTRSTRSDRRAAGRAATRSKTRRRSAQVGDAGARGPGSMTSAAGSSSSRSRMSPSRRSRRSPPRLARLSSIAGDESMPTTRPADRPRDRDRDAARPDRELDDRAVGFLRELDVERRRPPSCRPPSGRSRRRRPRDSSCPRFKQASRRDTRPRSRYSPPRDRTASRRLLDRAPAGSRGSGARVVVAVPPLSAGAHPSQRRGEEER